jgi:anti-sigma-K factor RskA
VSCLERRDLYLLYLTDGLEPSETAELRAHLATGCPTCAASLAEAQATLDLLPHALEPVEPPAAAWSKLSLRVGPGTEPGTARSSWRLYVPELALAASLLILIAGVSLWMQSRLTSVMSAPDAQMVVIAGTEKQPQTHGRLFLSPQQKRWQVTLDKMPAPPAGRTYELWIITDAGAKVPAGTFDASTSGDTVASAPIPTFNGKAIAFAITDEPRGGSIAPTGDIRVFGDVK